MIETQHRLVLKGEDCGPFTIRQLQSMWLAGSITSETLHWMEGYSEWLPLDFIREDLEPPVVAVRAAPVVAGVENTIGKKSRIAYIVIALVLGWCGAHNFYVERKRQGWIGLAIFTVTTSLLILYPAYQIYSVGRYEPLALEHASVTALSGLAWLLNAGVWLVAVLECILVSKDGNGRAME
jgi:GYF domain 2/TM2 domain